MIPSTEGKYIMIGQEVLPQINDLAKLFAKDLKANLFLWSIVSILITVLITHKFTKLDIFASIVVTMVTIILVGQFASLPFQIFNKIIFDPIKAFSLKQTSLTTKNIILIVSLVYSAFASAVSHQISLKIICYFSKKRKYQLGGKFLLYLFAAYNIPTFVMIVNTISTYFAIRLP